MSTPIVPEIMLELTPETRTAIINLSEHFSDEQKRCLAPFSKVLYCSHHTTAGFLEQSLCARIQHRRESVESLVQSAQRLFPEGASYWHDQMPLRSELSEEQKLVEPLNADSHLTFISLGMENCVAYDNIPPTPVFFIDLDGVFKGTQRKRKATAIGYNKADTVAECTLKVPMSDQSTDTINLGDPEHGIMKQLRELLVFHRVSKGKLELSLLPTERCAGLTMNEYETLLMKRDLIATLSDPLRFMRHQAIRLVQDPMAIPRKTIYAVRHPLVLHKKMMGITKVSLDTAVDMAKKILDLARHPMDLPKKAKKYLTYDLVYLTNHLLDTLNLDESNATRIIDRIANNSASRRLRLKRSVTMLINSPDSKTPGNIVFGHYQSPILFQWQATHNRTRTLHARLMRFE